MTTVGCRFAITVIKRFRHKGLERYYATGSAAGLSAKLVPRIRLIFSQLDVARVPAAMDAPGLSLHPLQGERHGQFAVSVSWNWRIVFAFDGEDATDVDLVDYH